MVLDSGLFVLKIYLKFFDKGCCQCISTCLNEGGKRNSYLKGGGDTRASPWGVKNYTIQRDQVGLWQRWGEGMVVECVGLNRLCEIVHFMSEVCGK